MDMMDPRGPKVGTVRTRTEFDDIRSRRRVDQAGSGTGAHQGECSGVHLNEGTLSFYARTYRTLLQTPALIHLSGSLLCGCRLPDGWLTEHFEWIQHHISYLPQRLRMSSHRSSRYCADVYTKDKNARPTLCKVGFSVPLTSDFILP